MIKKLFKDIFFHGIIFFSIVLSRLPKFIRAQFGPVSLEQLLSNLSVDVAFQIPQELVRHASQSLLIKPLLITLTVALSLKLMPQKLKKAWIYLLLIVAIVISSIAFWKLYHNFAMESFFDNKSDHPDWFSEFYVQPVTLKSSKKYNLVFLYLESMESRYVNSRVNSALGISAQQSLRAGHLPALPGTQWTFAAMIASQCSVPLIPFGLMHHYHTVDRPLAASTCIGDILKQAGYNSFYLTGGDKNFSGTDQFYHTHGFQRVLGLSDIGEAYPEVKKPEQWWGIYDSDLYSIAKDVLVDASSQQPFSFFFSTLDTHAPAGVYSPWCDSLGFSNDLSGVYDCAIEQAGQFISWFERQKFSNNTVLVIMGDHPFMGDGPKVANQNRDVFFMLKMPNQQAKLVDMTHFDVAPTILDSMGFDLLNHRMGLGRSLISGQSYLLQKYDSQNLNKIMRHSSASYPKLWITSE